MKKMLIPVCTGYEETELITTINVLCRNKIDYTLWSIEGLETVKSSHEAIVETKITFPANESFDGLFIPGGKAIEKLIDYDEIIHLVKKFNEEGKVVAAICSAPLILEKSLILDKKVFTGYENAEFKNKPTLNNIEVDGNIITGKNYKATLEFANEIVKKLKS